MIGFEYKSALSYDVVRMYKKKSGLVFKLIGIGQIKRV